MKLNQVTLSCIDYDASVTFYRALGLRQIVAAPPRYARFETPDGATLSIEVGAPGPGSIVYFEVDDVDATVTALAARGMGIAREPRDESWLWREARLDDPAGNSICIYNAGANRRFPPWRLPDAPVI